MLLLLALGLPGLASASLLDGARAVRTRGCGGSPGIAAPLRERRDLADVARALAGGSSLREALGRSELAVLDAATIHVSGHGSPETQARVLAQRFCDRLLDARVGSAGTYERGQDAWLVVARLPDEPTRVRTNEGRGRPAPALRDARGLPDGHRVLDLVNAARAQPRRCGHQSLGPAGPLAWSATLEAAARIQARDMARRVYFEHRGSDGSTPEQRVSRVGYRWSITGENLAFGPGSAEEVVDGWLGSPGHCANIMEPKFTEMGVAIESGPTPGDTAGYQPRGLYWAQSFGAPLR